MGEQAAAAAGRSMDDILRESDVGRGRDGTAAGMDAPVVGGGERMPVERAKEEDGPCTLFLGGLSYDSDEGAIKKVFEEFGKVLSTKMCYDYKTGMPRGFGFITFASAKSAEMAIAEMDGQIVDGRPIRVNKVQQRQHHTNKRHAGDDGGRWQKSRSFDNDEDRDRDRSYREHEDGYGAPGSSKRSDARAYKAHPGSPHRPAAHGPTSKEHSRSPEPEERGRLKKRSREYEEDFYDEDAYPEERDRENWRRPAMGRTRGQQYPTARSGSFMSRPSGSEAYSGDPAMPVLERDDHHRSPAAFQELKESVEAVRAEKEDLSARISALEKALDSSNTQESQLKEKIKNLEQTKKQATAQLEKKTAEYQKVLLALARLQEAQDRAKEAEKDLKAIVKPLLPLVQDKLEQGVVDASAPAPVPTSPALAIHGTFLPHRDPVGAAAVRLAGSDAANGFVEDDVDVGPLNQRLKVPAAA